MVRFEDVWLKYRRAGGSAQAGSAHAGSAHAGSAHAGSAHAGSPDVVSGVSFEIPDGGFRWLIGASGAGKTSVLKLIYLAERPIRGHIDILGTRVGKLDRRDLALLRRRIGVVYQDFRLLAHLSAYDNVALPMRLARRPEAQIKADVTELLRWVGLSEKHQSRPYELSGGEQQRIAIARAVIGRPKLLVADEPTGNLDDEQAERLMLLITALNRLGTTVVVATHNRGLVARYPAPHLEIAGGRLVADG
jgi:cell division transport system ATP-binding protein